jgi:hypothetical protein
VDFLLIGWQSWSPFPVNPGRQVQVIVLSGSVSYTLHSALATQGVNVEHGFLQSPRLFLTMQTSLLGQSLSSLHPSSLMGSGTKGRFLLITMVRMESFSIKLEFIAGSDNYKYVNQDENWSTKKNMQHKKAQEILISLKKQSVLSAMLQLTLWKVHICT